MSRRRPGQRNPPYKAAGLIVCVAAAVALAFIWFQFRGELTAKDQLVLISARAGLSMDPGAKVTYNGVQIGRVGKVEEISVGGVPRAKIILDVDSKYIRLIPKNVDATVDATTVFGNKYISFTSPKSPAKERITGSDVIDVTKVTTEFNTIFETVLSVSEQVDPIKLNQTLAATAEALDGLGDRFGESIVHGNEILADINPQMPQIRRDNRSLADLGAVYANAAPDLFDGLEDAVTTARALNEQQSNIDQALMAAIGFGNTGGDIFERGAPYLVRGAADLIPTSGLLDEYSPELFCTIRNYSDADIKAVKVLGGNGYSSNGVDWIMGVGNPYVYPDNQRGQLVLSGQHKYLLRR